MIPFLDPVTQSETFQNEAFEKAVLRRDLRKVAQTYFEDTKEMKCLVNCGRVMGKPTLILPKDSSPAYYMTESCGYASCPVCASKIGVRRLKDLEDLLNAFLSIM